MPAEQPPAPEPQPVAVSNGHPPTNGHREHTTVRQPRPKYRIFSYGEEDEAPDQASVERIAAAYRAGAADDGDGSDTPTYTEEDAAFVPAASGADAWPRH